MGNIGPMELILVAIIALVVIGPSKLPEAARSVGKSMREMRSAMSGGGDDDEAVHNRLDDTDEDEDEDELDDEDEPNKEHEPNEEEIASGEGPDDEPSSSSGSEPSGPEPSSPEHDDADAPAGEGRQPEPDRG